MSRDVFRQSANVLALVAILVVNALAVYLPLGGRTTGEISDMFPVRVTPAGYAFSIWSVIYLGLSAFAVYQALPAQRDNPRLRRVGYLFVLNALFNVAWLVAWHYLAVNLSLLIMFGLLATLVAIYNRLEVGRRDVPAAETWLVRVPFSLYLGWISVATLVNLTVVLYAANIGGWGAGLETSWTVLVIAVAAVVSLAVSWQRRDAAFNLVTVWALTAIAVKNWDVAVIAASALIAAAAVLAGLFYSLTTSRPSGRRPLSHR